MTSHRRFDDIESEFESENPTPKTATWSCGHRITVCGAGFQIEADGHVFPTAQAAIKHLKLVLAGKADA